MNLYNSLTKQLESFTPLQDNAVRMYSCGPTVYDHIHIGNLSAFIVADTLRRVLQASGNDVEHVMNFTDVDDKTIRRSRESYPDQEPKLALEQLTTEYGAIFLDDMAAVGNDVGAYSFVKATDAIPHMQELIRSLYDQKFAYIADDGVYFSIEAYKNSGKKYGQLVELSESSTSEARIANDEYDKENVHDFALWKTQKPGEPAWDFELDGHDLAGRPGWHIECSAMSTEKLGQPFDIHTGGVDLKFPHHENEIAQSTAGKDSPAYAKLFVHNEHLLVGGQKMSKSLNNFITLKDIIGKGYDPLAFRLLVLQSHYRNQAHFTWENLQASQNALKSLHAWSDLKFQNLESERLQTNYQEALRKFKNEIADDLKTPAALAWLNGMINRVEELGADSRAISDAVDFVDSILGLQLSERQDITGEQKQAIAEREEARMNTDWSKSDELRDRLAEQGIGLNDTPNGAIWYRI